MAKARTFFGNVLAIIGESSWVLFAFFFVAGVVFGLALEVVPGLDRLFDSTLGQLLAGGLIYALVVLLVVAPIAIRRGRPKVKQLLGIHKKPGRSIIWLPLVLWAAYMVTTVIVGVLAELYLPWVDIDQEQQVGFDDISQPVEYVLAFFALVVLPPIAEELLFRGYLFGRLRERFGFWLTTIVVSLMFGLVHMQWNVGIDTAVLSIYLCYLREKTGSVWASIVLHAIKNGLAYFLLFIAPLLGWSLIQ